MLSIIGCVAPRLNSGDDQTALFEQGQAIMETALSRNPVTMDRNDIEAAWQKARSVLEMEQGQ